MNVLQSLIPQNMFEKIDKAGIGTPRQILMLSVLDVKKFTNLTNDDIVYLKNIVSNYYKPTIVACDKMKKCYVGKRTASGCVNIDKLLYGGFAIGTITEVYGESGSGKTQLGITTAVNCWPGQCVYICTEDLFPVKRLNQMKNHISGKGVSYSEQHIFVEHLTESHELMSCIKVRLPKLLQVNNVSCIIIDSIAATFRCEFVNYVKRAEELREIAVALITLAQKHSLSVICINQVTSLFDDSTNVFPSLGLAWSNMVTYRLMLKKLPEQIKFIECPIKNLKNSTHVRELSVKFAPDLPNSSAKFIITSEGLQSIP
ncbi:DNA repair protein XRCC3 [Battus philenor]|uniref:DNA repair protein XRCC3 n=1 Tax=Battus philenor TaxID=42288 RepID=UPI0035D00A6C